MRENVQKMIHYKKALCDHIQNIMVIMPRFSHLFFSKKEFQSFHKILQFIHTRMQNHICFLEKNIDRLEPKLDFEKMWRKTLQEKDDVEAKLHLMSLQMANVFLWNERKHHYTRSPEDNHDEINQRTNELQQLTEIITGVANNAQAQNIISNSAICRPYPQSNEVDRSLAMKFCAWVSAAGLELSEEIKLLLGDEHAK